MQILTFNGTFPSFPHRGKTSHSSCYLPAFHALLRFSFAAKNLFHLGWKNTGTAQAAYLKIRDLTVKSGSGLSAPLLSRELAARIQEGSEKTRCRHENFSSLMIWPQLSARSPLPSCPLQDTSHGAASPLFLGCCCRNPRPGQAK